MAKKKSAPAPKDQSADDDDIAVVICFPTRVGMAGVPNSARVPCAECATDCWLSPETAKQVANLPHKICCDECASKQKLDGSTLMPVSEGQMRELINYVPNMTLARVKRDLGMKSLAKRKKILEEILREARRRRGN